MVSNSKHTVACTTGDKSCDALDQQLARSWLRIAIAGVFAGQGMVFSLAVNMTPPPFASPVYWVLHGGLVFSSVVVLLFLGSPLLRSTFGMLRARRLSIEGLFTLSLIGAFVGSLASSLTGNGGVYYEVVSIVIGIYTLGRMLGERSQARLTLESDRLREKYDTAYAINNTGEVELISVADVEVGSRVRVGAGDPFTVDGVLVSGHGYVRETALTGEPLPVVKGAGDRVKAGTWSVDGTFELEVVCGKGARELDQILETVESMAGEPSKMQVQANQLIQWFLPLVAAVSLFTAIYWLLVAGWVDAVFNSMAVLLVACPCAMGLATPVAIWQGLYGMAQIGLVSRNGSLIDTLAQTKHVFFDKTGTLSETNMRVTEQVVAEAFTAKRDELLQVVRAVQERVPHPIARALVEYIPTQRVVDLDSVELLPGQGVRALVSLGGSSHVLCIGELGLVRAEFKSRLEVLRKQLFNEEGKLTVVTVDELPAMLFVAREHARVGVTALWGQLGELGIETTVLTGDPEPHFKLPASVTLNTGLSAAEKAERIRVSAQCGEVPLFVGDGVNDAAAMSCAGSSIAMGSGAGFTKTTATGQLTSDHIQVLPQAVKLSRSIAKRLRGNLIYAASYNMVGMLFAALGWLHPVLAAAIMLVSSLLVTARAIGHRQDLAASCDK